MDDGIDLMGRKEAAQGRPVADVADDELGSVVGDVLNTVDDLALAVAEVIEYDNLGTRLQQLHNRVRADVAGATGDQNGLVLHEIL